MNNDGKVASGQGDSFENDAHAPVIPARVNVKKRSQDASLELDEKVYNKVNCYLLVTLAHQLRSLQ